MPQKHSVYPQPNSLGNRKAWLARCLWRARFVIRIFICKQTTCYVFPLQMTYVSPKREHKLLCHVLRLTKPQPSCKTYLKEARWPFWTAVAMVNLQHFAGRSNPHPILNLPNARRLILESFRPATVIQPTLLILAGGVTMGGMTVSLAQDEKVSCRKIRAATLGSILDTSAFHKCPPGICGLSMNVRAFVGCRTNVH